MNAERIQELAMLNALGALEGAEREDLRAQLALPEAAVLSDVATFNDLAALMAIASTAPHEVPPTLKEKVLQRIAPHRSGGDSHSRCARWPPPRRRPW